MLELSHQVKSNAKIIMFKYFISTNLQNTGIRIDAQALDLMEQ